MAIRARCLVLPLLLAAAVPAIAVAQSPRDSYEQEDRSPRAERGDRNDREEWGRRGDHAERGDRGDRGEWSRRGDRGERGDRQGRERPTTEMRERLLDGEVALVKATLRLTDAQLRLWSPVEAYIRSEAEARRSQRSERRWSREDDDRGSSRGERRRGRSAETTTTRDEGMRAYEAVYEPFYASLDVEQKKLADYLMGEDDEPRGRRWAMERQREPDRR